MSIALNYTGGDKYIFRDYKKKKKTKTAKKHEEMKIKKKVT